MSTLYFYGHSYYILKELLLVKSKRGWPSPILHYPLENVHFLRKMVLETSTFQARTEVCRPNLTRECRGTEKELKNIRLVHSATRNFHSGCFKIFALWANIFWQVCYKKLFGNCVIRRSQANTGCSLNIVFFFEDFKIFWTLVFLCSPLVSVCVHTKCR